MVIIYGVTKEIAESLSELMIDSTFDAQTGLYEVTLCENVIVNYSFDELVLSDEVNSVTLDILDFTELSIE